MSKRYYLLFFLVFWIFSSCETPVLELNSAQSVSGIYQGKYINFSGSLVPLPLITGNSSFDVKITVNDRAYEKVDLILELIEKNGSNTYIDTERFYYLAVNKNQEGGFDLNNDSTTVAKVYKNELELKLEHDGISTTISAIKD